MARVGGSAVEVMSAASDSILGALPVVREGSPAPLMKWRGSQ